MEFDVIGVIAGISKVLANASISLLSISTFDTDYFLVSESDKGLRDQGAQVAWLRVRFLNPQSFSQKFAPRGKVAVLASVFTVNQQ